MKNFILFLTVLTFILEPMALMPKAQANSCTQGPQKTQQKCTGNTLMQNGQMILGIAGKVLNGDADNGQKQGVSQAKQSLDKANADYGAGKQQCTQAGEECSSACDQEIGRKKSLQQDYSQEEQAKQACKEEQQKGEGKADDAMKQFGQLLQAIMGLLAAMKGNKEDKKEEELAKKEDEEICDTPEGAFLVECQCEKNSEGKCIIEPKNTASRLGGSTFGAYAGAGVGGDVQARPADAEFESKLQDGAVGAASVGNNGGLGGPTGFGSSPSPASGGGVTPSSDKAVNADISKGFHAASGGGGGFGSFGGGGSKGGSYSGSFGRDTSAGPGEKAINKKLNRALSSRSPASIRDAKTTGGPFGDNFFTIKNAYKKQKASMYHHQQ